MTDYDVVVIGAGAAGLSAGALLAAEGKRVLVTDRSPVLGGRAMAVPDEGFKVNVGGHLIEDPGSGLTKVFEHVGKELVHGAVSAEMPVWDHEKQAWGSVRDRYSGSKAELKKVIKALIDTPYEELDRWDDRNLRQWLHQHTSDQGVIDLFEFITVLECMTENWWDHSARDNLFVRQMHFSERGTAAYSCWPGQGWDGMWADLADAIRVHGGELRLGTQVERVLIENHEVKGFFFQAEDGIRDVAVTGVQTCALPILTFSSGNTCARTFTDFHRRTRTLICAAHMCCHSKRSSAWRSAMKRSRTPASSKGSRWTS